MEERETHKEIDRIAAHWVARMDRAPLSASESAELQHWLAGDRRRRGAFMRAKAVWMRSEAAHALGSGYDPADFPSPSTAPPRARAGRRWHLMEWGGAMAASLLLVVVLATTLQMPTAYATAKGEMRTVRLGDDATVTLNTDTRIQVYDDGGRRRIRLLRGEVLIEDAGTQAPTRMDVDGMHLEASAATFLVRKLDGRPTQILVQQGRVALAGTTPSAKALLMPETGVSLPARGGQGWHATPLSFGQMGRELAWREGKIALQGETLAEAAAVYARYNDTPIVIADPKLARMRITGLFAAHNPLGFSRAVAEVFGAEVRQEDGRIIVDRAH